MRISVMALLSGHFSKEYDQKPQTKINKLLFGEIENSNKDANNLETEIELREFKETTKNSWKVLNLLI